jgi:hypothetical protein
MGFGQRKLHAHEKLPRALVIKLRCIGDVATALSQ